MENGESLEERLDRLESIEEIRGLAARYCLALDMRATDAWVSLFPDDVQVGQGRSGRTALAEWFRETMGGKFTGTAHVTGNHIIEFDGPDRARGVVYSRNEHETGDEWVVMTMMYWDDYERIDRPMVLSAPPTPVLVRHRLECSADRGQQDALAQ